MADSSILSLIDQEIAQLKTVRRLLEQTNFSVQETVTRKTVTKSTAKKTAGKRVLSPEARKRIGDAQKKRWAAQKKK